MLVLANNFLALSFGSVIFAHYMWFRVYAVFVHIFAWLAFFLATLAIVPKPEIRFRLPNFPFPPFFLLLFPCLAAFFYFNRWYLIPKLLGRQHKKGYIFSVVIVVLGILILTGLEQNFMIPSWHEAPPGIRGIHFLLTILLLLVVFMASSGQMIIKFWFAAEARQREMELEKSNAELTFLKSQINPHFLFNTLNNIYTLNLLNPENASEYILKLSNLLRYVLSDASMKEVDLQQEIDCLAQFIDLQKIRLTDKVKVDYQVFGEASGKRIAPLLMIPFVENAFKYGVPTKSETQIRIHLFINPENLVFQTENEVFADIVPQNQSTGTGLKNAVRRLELLYPNKHWLRIETVNNSYFVDLSINF